MLGMETIGDELRWLTDHQEFQQIDLLNDWRAEGVEEVRDEAGDEGVENLRTIIEYLREELSQAEESTLSQGLQQNDVPLSVSLLLLDIASQEGERQDWDYIRSRIDSQEDLEEVFEYAIRMYTSREISGERPYERDEMIMEKFSNVIHMSILPRIFEYNDGYEVFYTALTDEFGLQEEQASLILDLVQQNRAELYRTYNINLQKRIVNKIDDLSDRIDQIEDELETTGVGDGNYREERASETISDESSEY